MSERGDVQYPTWQEKKREYEERMNRAKGLRRTCTICGKKAKLPCPCGTTQYCSVACQKVDWRERGHREACKKIRDDRAAEAARAEAPTPPPSPPRDVFYGPAPRSHADEVRARIAAEHEAARARREANPEREPTTARYGSRCPICLEEWDVNAQRVFRTCCCRLVCKSCQDKVGTGACPLCRVPHPKTDAEQLAQLRRHVENEVPEAISFLGNAYSYGFLGLVKSGKKAAKILKRAVELGDLEAMRNLGSLYESGGEGVKMDKKKAERLYRAAADRGDPLSQTALANLIYDIDTGVGDKVEAKALWELGAGQGHAKAEYFLGVLLDEEENYEEAFAHYKRAAERKYMNAQYNLAYCFEHGEGTAVDLAEAAKWYARALSQGDKDAQEALDRVRAIMQPG